MGLGLLLSGLSGGGQAVDESLASTQKAQQAQDLMQQQQELQAQKAIQVSQATQANAADLADTQREQAASRIQAAAQPYLSQAVLQNAMADHDWVSAQKESGMPISAASLSSDDLDKYAATPQQRLAATVAGAKDTGDLAPQGLLQAQLSDQANQRMVDMQQAQITSQEAMEASREKNQKDVAAMYASRSGSGAANDPGVQIAMSAGAKLDAQAREADIAINKLRTEIASGNIPKTVNGEPNPDYAAAVTSLNSAVNMSQDLHNRSIQLYAHAGSKTGLPPDVLRAITGSGPAPGGATSGAPGALVYNPATGKVEAPAASAADSAPLPPDMGVQGDSW